MMNNYTHAACFGGFAAASPAAAAGGARRRWARRLVEARH